MAKCTHCEHCESAQLERNRQTEESQLISEGEKLDIYRESDVPCSVAHTDTTLLERNNAGGKSRVLCSEGRLPRDDVRHSATGTQLKVC